MSIKSAPYYWVECDACGSRYESDEYTAWDSQGYAESMAIDSDWTTDSKKHHCDSCPPLTTCADCGEPAGDVADDRDYHRGSCWAELTLGATP